MAAAAVNSSSSEIYFCDICEQKFEDQRAVKFHLFCIPSNKAKLLRKAQKDTQQPRTPNLSPLIERGYDELLSEALESPNLAITRKRSPSEPAPLRDRVHVVKDESRPKSVGAEKFPEVKRTPNRCPCTVL